MPKQIQYLLVLIVSIGFTPQSMAQQSQYRLAGVYTDEVYTYDAAGIETGELTPAQLSELLNMAPVYLTDQQYDPDTGFIEIELTNGIARLHDAEVEVIHYRPVNCSEIAKIDRNLDGMGANSACEDATSKQQSVQN